MSKKQTKAKQKQRLSDKQKIFIEAFQKQATNIARACEVAQIGRATYYRWYETNETFKEKIDEIREGMIDFAESMLFKNMKTGKESSILFFLKTRGRERGYVEKKELDMTVREHKTMEDFYAEENEEPDQE